MPRRSQDEQIRRRGKEEAVKKKTSLVSVTCVKGGPLKAYARRGVYQFPRPAITEYHKLGGLGQQKPVVYRF